MNTRHLSLYFTTPNFSSLTFYSNETENEPYREKRNSRTNSLQRAPLFNGLRRKCYTTHVLRSLVFGIHVTSNDAMYHMIQPWLPRSYKYYICSRRSSRNRYSLRGKLYGPNPIRALRRTQAGISRVIVRFRVSFSTVLVSQLQLLYLH